MVKRERRAREEGYILPPRFRTDLRIDDRGRECVGCGQYKPWIDYHVDSKSRSGHQSSCKECIRRRQRKREKTDEFRANAARRTAEHRERKRVPGWQPSQATRHAQLNCDGAEHQCTGCEERKPLGDFPQNKETPCGHDPRCKKCRHERRVGRRQTDHNGIRTKELDRPLLRFGITGTDYLWLLDLQGGGCALCGEPESQGDKYFAGKKRLSVDHDHDHCGPSCACKECIRGLLCHNCNIGLGMFEGKAATRSVFADYLVKRPFLAA